MPKFEDLSVEDLSKMLGVEPEEGNATEAETVPESQSEETPKEPAEEEKAPEAETTETPQVETAPVADLPEHYKLMLEEAEARAKKWESVAGRHAGELGYVRKSQAELLDRIKEMEARVAGQSEQLAQEDTEPQSRPRRSTRDSIASWAVNRALMDAGQQFMASHPDIPELKDYLAAYMNERKSEISSISELDDPLEAQMRTLSLLEEGYWHAKAEAKAKARPEAEKKYAEQIKGFSEMKKKAAISASGSTQSTRPRDKADSEMSLQELEEKIRRLTSSR
jgi:hypothetical protein